MELRSDETVRQKNVQLYRFLAHFDMKALTRKKKANPLATDRRPRLISEGRLDSHPPPHALSSKEKGAQDEMQSQGCENSLDQWSRPEAETRMQQSLAKVQVQSGRGTEDLSVSFHGV